MRRTFWVCATLGALSLVLSQQVRADGVRNLIGTYAFTLAESCVQQVSLPLTDANGNILPAFGPDFTINDPLGAMTYGGASDGLMVFDGKGKVSIENAEATNIFNADSSYGDNAFLTTGKIPLGFGFGPALPFSCVGTYTVSGGQITINNLQCTATISPTNPGNLPPHNPNYPNGIITGFTSTFNLKGVLPQDLSHLLLTDIGNNLQSVTIFVNGGASQGGADVPATRVCTRSTTLGLVSGPESR